jgi:hypothetical protein
MAKITVYTFKNHLGYDGKKFNKEKALTVLEKIGYNATNDIGETPLIVASYLESIEILKTIIENVDNIDYKVPDTFTETALLMACEQRRLKSIKLLVEAGAKLEQTDRFGLTPLSKIFTNTFSDPIPSADYLISEGAKITDRFIEMGMSWDSEKFVAFLDKQNIAFDRNLVSKKEIVEVEKVDTTLDINTLHNIVNDKNYDKTNKVIWQKLVPSSGQADTIQGELLRAIEKLRDEAQRNGNGNFTKNCHGLLVKYLKEHLINKTIFDEEVVAEIKKNLKLISRATMPYTEDDVYDYISNRIVDWYLKNPTQIPHIKNETLYC